MLIEKYQALGAPMCVNSHSFLGIKKHMLHYLTSNILNTFSHYTILKCKTIYFNWTWLNSG